MGVLKPELIFKSIVPVIMAGILGIYGLIIALLIFQKGNTHYYSLIIVDKDTYEYFDGYKHLSSGLCCGVSSLVSKLRKI